MKAERVREDRAENLSTDAGQPAPRGLYSLGEVGEMIRVALLHPPSAGAIGRMELLWRWDHLTEEKRKSLLRFARQMGEPEEA
ncbi:hypothetical protein [Muricoccus radiodurans]|uniref:hypothetical protein n=1 Tax=Muricoccus radiodurans TaxID=2231721 RepID=UPI003CF8A1D7